MTKLETKAPSVDINEAREKSLLPLKWREPSGLLQKYQEWIGGTLHKLLNSLLLKE